VGSTPVGGDGYTWDRGQGDGNLSLIPDPENEWESQMVEYPSIIEEAGGRRLFYCGNGYGKTGIGTATTA
jgi:hypothetical protein